MEGAARDTRTFIGLHGRSSPTIRWLAGIVSDGYVGDVLSATVLASSIEWGNPFSERMRYTLDRTLGATMLTIAFGNAIDLVSMLVGELQDVIASTATRRPIVPLGSTGQTGPDDRRGPDRRLRDAARRSDPLRPSPWRNGVRTWVLPDHRRYRRNSRNQLPRAGIHTSGRLRCSGARGHAPLSRLRLPDGHDDYPHLAGTPIHNLAHTYSAIRNDLIDGTTTAPDFAHAVKRHRLLDAIARSSAEGRHH